MGTKEDVELKKYKLMWEKLEEEWGHIDITSLGVRETLSQWMDDLKQKHFPIEIGNGLPVEGGLRGFVKYLNTVGEN